VANELKGIRIIEIGGAVAMPIVGSLLGGWGAEVIHVEPPGKGDAQRYSVASGMFGWSEPHHINYLWEHVDRNKKSMTINLGSHEGQAVIHKLIATADVFMNNLRPYEMEKFQLTYEKACEVNPKIIYANVTGYGKKGSEKNIGGYDSVAFWARSGVMELMHDSDTAPNISRPAYGDHVTALSLLAGVMSALFIRERTGVAQEVDISLYNTATWVLGFDISGCLITGQDAKRPQRKTMGNPVRNVYPTKDKRWIMLGMTNSDNYWPDFCSAIERPEIEKDPRFASYDARMQNAGELVKIIDEVFLTKTYAEWIETLRATRLLWSPVVTPLETTKDEQAWANDFFREWDHPEYGKIKVINNPVKLSKTKEEIRCRAPKLGEHTDQLLRELGYADDAIEKMRKSGTIG
jgi:crotonobetainyl-CoA:carnitine CoA-transferase CaiB-like acyl-CoA transferase